MGRIIFRNTLTSAKLPVAENQGFVLANFERLIKGALASQDASSPEVRQVIYQSSRNALQKIIDNNRSLTIEAVMEQKRQLEVSIETIEATYNPAKIVPEPILQQTQEAQAEPVIEDPVIEDPVLEEPVLAENEPQEPAVSSPAEEVSPQIKPEASVPETDPLHEIQQILESTTPQGHAIKTSEAVSPPVEQSASPEPAVQVEPDAVLTPQPELSNDHVQVSDAQSEAYFEEHENVPLGFSKRRKTQKRILWTLIVLIVLGLLAWIGYLVFTSMLNGTLLGNNNDGQKLNPNSISRQADADNYITVIEASDLSSLEMAGRGKAQIVKELNSDMIRINSVRDALNRAEQAKPILIKLKPGVLKQISGKRVTVEIFAKSGGSETAHFAIGCEFGELTECGRKRFLAGSQPNASVFAFQMDQISDINQDMYLTLSTDTTSEAAVTGKGDLLDIVYIRLSVDN